MMSSRFVVKIESPGAASRPAGVAARQKLLAMLSTQRRVEVDLEGVSLTPSFADEFLAALVDQFGTSVFRERVIVVNASSSAKALLNHVVRRRFEEHRRHGNDHAAKVLLHS